MNGIKYITVFFELNSLAALFLSIIFVTQAFAHGGEDHGDSKSATVTTDKGTVTHTAKVGDLEILLKHAAFEPDTTNIARLFVTRFATNEPLGNASPTIQITSSDGKTFEAEEIKTGAPGSYSVKLPPLPEGKYTVLVRIAFEGETDTATFSNISVTHTNEAANAGNGASWLWNVLFGFGAIAILGAIGTLGYFAFRYAQRGQETSKQAVSA